MRTFLLVPVLALGVGCNQCCKLPAWCCPNEPCEPCRESPPCPSPARQPAPAPCPPAPVQVNCPRPKLEFRAPEEVRIKAPPQKIIVETAPAPPCAAPTPSAAPTPPTGAPFAPMPVQAVPQYAMMPAAPQAGPGVTTQTVTRKRDRITLGLERVNIPFIVPRFFSVPGGQEVVTRTEYPPPSQAVMPVAMAPQVAMAPVAAVPQPQYAAVPAAAPMPMAAPQMQMAMVPQVQMAMVPQPQYALQPAPPVQMAPLPPAAPPAQAAPQVDCYQALQDCYRRVQELEAQLRARGGQ